MAKIKKRKALTAVVAVTLIGTGVSFWLFWQKEGPWSAAPEGYVRLKEYVHPKGVMCTGSLPECGVCPGMVIDKKCYVKKESAVH